ncbi:MAG: type IV secretory system conjugative DNA transfer family protein, partial [Oricola sp.]|nr:type IV secretory system conjugative DNA transfer family protein [Oricola sp.]
ERSGVLSTALSHLTLFRDPLVARITGASDWRIADLKGANKPVSLYLVVPPSDISRTRPLMRLLLNQIGRRLTERLDGAAQNRKLLMMLDEFPALGRLDFFESALAFMAGYGVRAYLIAQSLNQIEKAYGPKSSILDNCHVRVAFAANDERTAKRISDALGTATELRAQKNYAGHRLAPWLAHVMVSRQETARPLLTPGEVMQLPRDEAVALVAGVPPIRAKKLRYYEDANFMGRVQAPPQKVETPPARADDWSDCEGSQDKRLDHSLFNLAHESEDKGGRKLKPSFTAPEKEPTHQVGREDDIGAGDNHAAAARRFKDLADDATRKAAIIDRDPQSILPGF